MIKLFRFVNKRAGMKKYDIIYDINHDKTLQVLLR